MADAVCILFPGDKRWRVGAMREGSAELRDVPVESIVNTMRELGCSPKSGVVLAVPSAWCFVATIDVSDLRAKDRKAMIYRLEEKLPIPAEEFIADFAGHSTTAIGVAIQTARIKPILDDLDAAGITVQSIVPAPLLAAQSFEKRDAMMFVTDGVVDLVVFRDCLPVGLSTFPQNHTVDPDIAALSTGVDVHGIAPEPSLESSAVSGADAIHHGRASQWIELRRDALGPSDRLGRHRRSLDAVLAAIAIFLIALAGASFLRAIRYERAATESQSRLAHAFAKSFPGWEAPASVKSVIQSEKRKLAMTSPARAAQPMAPRSALSTMQRVLGSIPSDSRFALERMTFENSAFELQGRAVSLDGMSSITAALRSAGWDLPQPQGHRDDVGFWSFTIRGNQPGASAPVALGEETRTP